MWDFALSSKNYKLYAISNYKNGKATWTDFFNNMKSLTYLPKLLNSWEDLKKSIYALNLIVHLSDCFKNESLARLLFYLSPKDNYSELKTLLFFISRLPEKIPEVNLMEIEINFRYLKFLEEI